MSGVRPEEILKAQLLQEIPGNLNMSNSGDEFEVLGYFTGFWLFIFNAQFRNSWLTEFRKKSFLTKIWSLFQAGIAIVCGAIFPSSLIYYILQNSKLFNS